MTKEDMRIDLEVGSKEAAEKAHVPELRGNEVDFVLDVLTEPTKIVSLEQGKEVVLTRDGGNLHYAGCSRYAGIPMSKEQAVWVGERVIGFDTMELGHTDYSFKPVKPIAFDEAHHVENIQMFSIIPVFYGAMPNLATYYQSLGGRFPSPTELIKAGKMKEAKEVQERAVEDAIKDIMYTVRIMYEAGVDGINFDTTASAGDAEFYASLLAVEQTVKETGLPVEVGMSGEMIMGTHCDLRYHDKLLAGQWPHEQGKMVEKAGASIFGPVVNTKVTKSFAWNLGRSITFIKACRQEVQIPIHVNMGMGVCGIPMAEITPVDAVTRAAKAMISVADVDGI